MNAEQRKRFWEKVTKNEGNGVWGWTGAIKNKGYGKLTLEGKGYLAHRVAYRLTKGKIGDGFELDHLCRNTRCVNPSHLDAVTHKENILRSKSPISENAAKTHCIYGHPYDESNTYYNPRGQRNCRECNRLRSARNRERARRTSGE